MYYKGNFSNDAGRSGLARRRRSAWREYSAVNGERTNGGAFDAHGAMLADDLLMVTAGYRYVGQQRGGNAFLLFQVQLAHD